MDSHVPARAISSNRVAGAVVGACYVLIGVAGLTLSATTGFTADEGVHVLVFQLNPLHTVLHLALGAALGLAAYRGLRQAMLVNAVVGACFGALGVLGVFLLDTGMNPLALNGADNVLHLSSAVVLLGIAAARR